MGRCRRCKEKGVIHYPLGYCTRCTLEIVNNLTEDTQETA